MIGEGNAKRNVLTDLVIELAEKSAGLRSSLPPSVVSSLADLVRSMNCYYSNLIEGHNTHPVDIERALKDDFSDDPQKRNLQLEAKAHVEVQAWIDEGGLDNRALTKQGLFDIHRRFCERLPDDLMWVPEPGTDKRVRLHPGRLRTLDVQVGGHVSISPGALPRFMARFEQAYVDVGKTDTILAAATAHHRLLWIHPFLDGNGRVARLMSYAILLKTLNTGGVWSVARGLARNDDAYKKHLMACDQARRNDLDGRGHLSEEALAEFVIFFFTTCIDQVDFMKELMQPDRLRDRILIWAEEEIRGNRLPPKADTVLQAVLYRGDLPRGEVAALLGTGDRQARRVTSALLDHGVLASTSSRAPLTLAFPARLAARWMPGLFPERS